MTMANGYMPSVGYEILEEVIPDPRMDLPTELSWVSSLRDVIDQGDAPYCVLHAFQSSIDACRSLYGLPLVELDRDRLFRLCGGTEDGVPIESVLCNPKLKGFPLKGEANLRALYTAASLRSCRALLEAIYQTGPALIALPYYGDKGLAFWRGNGRPDGGHVVSAVGWVRDGILFRNSWGDRWCDGGYGVLPFGDFPLILESWAVVWSEHLL